MESLQQVDYRSTGSEIFYRRIVPDTLIFMSVKSSVIGCVVGKAKAGNAVSK